MDGIENARHDLFEAASSVETAIDLLASLGRDGHAHAAELKAIVAELEQVRNGLEHSYQSLLPLSPDDH